MDPFFRKIKDEVDDAVQARQLSWDEYWRRCNESGDHPDKEAFKFAFDAALSFGQFRVIDPGTPLDDNP